ncbi:alpha/beta hydrolase [Paenibacillus sp. MMS20-IR301]|uniref:alpha/beta fold hydrolase n=1 Tax=Paenibacillus sp. MMS20-IR301 TaxID=2895946 RepID=UPI0028E43409|nr:alpha/beta hydrolase [Paenibacillus sp. MMS20-IR301]WNS42389.1 alpha/beta hydrolase [Paenibacillus sp. MMS20-IR301]
MNNVLARNKVRIIGKGEQTLVFAHGFGCDQSMWQYITPAFENNYRLVLFDYVGSGNSDLSAYSKEKYGDFGGYVQDALDVMEALQLRDVIFIGHSVSSMIGMHAAIERPELFAKLIMIGPSACYLNDSEGYNGGFERSDVAELLEMMEMNFAGWASFMAPLAMKNPELPELTKDLERTFIAGDPVIAREFAEVTFLSDHRAELSKSTLPTLIMQCSDDSIVPLEAGEYLHKHLSNSTFRQLEAKGHYPHISHPEETITLIREFLQ